MVLQVCDILLELSLCEIYCEIKLIAKIQLCSEICEPEQTFRPTSTGFVSLSLLYTLWKRVVEVLFNFLFTDALFIDALVLNALEFTI